MFGQMTVYRNKFSLHATQTITEFVFSKQQRLRKNERMWDSERKKAENTEEQ